MKKITAATLAIFAFAVLSTAQIPMPPAPTKAHVWAAVSKNLEVDRAVLTVIQQDPWFKQKLAEVGIGDIAKAPMNQPLPYDILTAWPGNKRFKIAVIDTDKEGQIQQLTAKLVAMEKALEDSKKTIALNSATILGQVKRIADRLDAAGAGPRGVLPNEADLPAPPASDTPILDSLRGSMPPENEVPAPSAVAPAPAPEKPKKKPFFPWNQ